MSQVETRYFIQKRLDPANIYLWKANNRNTRKRWEICSKWTIKTPERRHYFWAYFIPFSGVSIVEFEQVNVSWGAALSLLWNAS